MQEYLKKIKNEQNLSIEEMAEKIGVSCSLLAKVFYGQRQPSKKFIRKFKTAFPKTDTNIFFTQ